MLYQLLAGGIVRFIDFGIGVETEKAGSFAFEKCAAFSGLLLIGLPVAIIFEVMKMADVRIGRCFG